MVRYIFLDNTEVNNEKRLVSIGWALYNFTLRVENRVVSANPGVDYAAPLLPTPNFISFA